MTDTLNVHEIAEQLAGTDDVAVEEFRTDSFSLEVMRFGPDDEDPMHAHEEDEVYIINSGEGVLNVEGDLRDVKVGDVVHLGPGTDHRFQDFGDELVVTVLYAPPEHSAE